MIYLSCYQRQEKLRFYLLMSYFHLTMYCTQLMLKNRNNMNNSQKIWPVAHTQTHTLCRKNNVMISKAMWQCVLSLNNLLRRDKRRLPQPQLEKRKKTIVKKNYEKQRSPRTGNCRRSIYSARVFFIFFFSSCNIKKIKRIKNKSTAGK